MAKTKPEGYRPKKLTDEELWNSVYQVVLKAALHNKSVTVESINETTDALVKTIKSITDV
jgi:hypothetical protein